MSLRYAAVCLLATCLFVSCINQRSVTHWIVNNDTPSDVAIDITVQKIGSETQTVHRHTLKPGMGELKASKTSRGRYTITAGTADGTVFRTHPAYFDDECWVMISFNNNDSATLARKFGYLDTATFKKHNGLYSGFLINVESRMPSILYRFNKKPGGL